jgi:hypothetical protein
MAAGFACVILDESISAPLKPQLTAPALASIAAACTVQLNRHLSPYYGGAYSVRVGANAADVQPGELVFAIVDSLPDAPGAEAYHDLTGTDAPDAFLALNTCTSLDDVSTGISHELCESAGDPGCNRWVDDMAGTERALELCDAVQANSYKEGTIALSDFVLPAFFEGAAAPGPYSFCQATSEGSTNVPAGPFETTGGGYQLQRSSGTGETQVTGELGIRKDKSKHWSSRAYTRGLRAK